MRKYREKREVAYYEGIVVGLDRAMETIRDMLSVNKSFEDKVTLLQIHNEIYKMRADARYTYFKLKEKYKL